MVEIQILELENFASRMESSAETVSFYLLLDAAPLSIRGSVLEGVEMGFKNSLKLY